MKDKPFKLDCGHIFCLNCINIINHFKISASFYFDHKRLCFDNSIPRNDLIEHMKSICQLHILEIKGICIMHNVKICNKCNIDHKNCKTLIGNAQEIDLKINEIITTINKKDFLRFKFLLKIISIYSTHTLYPGAPVIRNTNIFS